MKGSRVAGWLPVLAVQLMLTGCGGGGGELAADRLAVFPVHGQVIWKDEPVADATVSLHSEGLPGSYARTDEDGQFELTTYEEGDGAPAGDYTVTVTKVVNVNQQDAPGEIDAELPAAEFRSEIPEYLSAPESSGLNVSIAPDSDNALEIVLSEENGGSRVNHNQE